VSSRTLPSLALLVLAACGGSIDATPLPPPVDASLRVDSASDAGSVPAPDAADDPDAAMGDASDAQLDGGACVPGACGAPTVQYNLSLDPLRCKYIVTWTCGSASYQVMGGGIGGCDEDTDPARGFRGECYACGATTGAFDSGDPMGCKCHDDANIASLAAKECGFPL
jgi:hypothetical protein